MLERLLCTNLHDCEPPISIRGIGPSLLELGEGPGLPKDEYIVGDFC